MLTIQASIQTIVPRILGPVQEFQGKRCRPVRERPVYMNEPRRKLCYAPMCPHEPRTYVCDALSEVF